MDSILREKDEYETNLRNVKEFIAINIDLNENFEKICFSDTERKGEILDDLRERYISIMNTPVTYNAAIISIYGCFEAYIDKIANLLLDYWKENAKCYLQISKNIREKHIQKCGEFLSNPQRYHNIDITSDNVVKNLDLCLKGETLYVLNKELILSHSGNLKFSQLQQFFNELGIKDSKSKIIKNRIFVNYISDKYELNYIEAEKLISSRNFDDKFLFRELDELVNQRNKVAHGWSVDERLSKEYLVDEIIPYMQMIGRVIAEMFMSEFVEILNETDSLKQFDKAIKVYNNKILCINSKDAILKCSDYIYTYDGKGYKALKIKNIQKDNINVEKIYGGMNNPG